MDLSSIKSVSNLINIWHLFIFFDKRVASAIAKSWSFSIVGELAFPLLYIKKSHAIQALNRHQNLYTKPIYQSLKLGPEYILELN